MKRKMAELKEGINSRWHWLSSRLANAESVAFTTTIAFVSATGVCLRRRSRLGGLYVSSRAVRVSSRGRHGGRMVALLETLVPARVPAAQPSGLAGCGQQRPRLFDLVAALLGVCLICALPTEVSAISGGGLDYAGQQLSGQDLSKQKLAQKDFSGAICRGASFAGSDLSGARFFKADLTEADFHDAQLTGASLEQTVLRGQHLP
ncbi:hypothetical protein F1559_004019 [Cyanidiococcus yangmingshanensis]|uniref:Pentapeptide repeat-containing protein n=1 Tax=Cyanidiococcus yangmingshanensis TaxID=2690220 RepID=A0A7J7IP42_9RHOD|nr:hypothetical protein F1559_004019 [Cyanidiococcus yangmingshanensis]